MARHQSRVQWCVDAEDLVSWPRYLVPGLRRLLCEVRVDSLTGLF